MRVRWSPLAGQRLNQICRYVARENPIAARRIAHRLAGLSEHLADAPRMGRMLQPPGIDWLRELIDPPYRIIYAIHTDWIEVVSVRDLRRRLPRNPADW